MGDEISDEIQAYAVKECKRWFHRTLEGLVYDSI